MAGSVEAIKELRHRTGAGMMDCKKALDECDTVEKAVDFLREKGLIKAAKKAEREASEGHVFSYIHTNHKIGVLLELNCETDFVAKTDEFQKLGREICMQIAAANPGYLCEAEVPADTIAKEKEILLAQIENEEKESGKSKPEQVKAKMVEGKIAKFFKENCLINQIFVKDQEITVAKFTENTAKELGGDIKITKFVRFEKGEGIEKREDDFAAEIASLVK